MSQKIEPQNSNLAKIDAIRCLLDKAFKKLDEDDVDEFNYMDANIYLIASRDMISQMTIGFEVKIQDALNGKELKIA